MTDTKRHIEVQLRRVSPDVDDAIEICEHKGTGHPDTLTDGACEAASRELSLAYRRQCGRVLHHNLDKGLLIAGRSEPRFGGGRVLAPMRFIVAGRATPMPDGTPVARVVSEAVRRHLQRQAGLEVDTGDIGVEVGETSNALRQAFDAVAATARANDTSFGAGYAPYSRLERCVLGLAEELRSPRFRDRFPAAGADFKVMGLRNGEQVELTLALAMIDRHVEGAAHYFEIERAVHDALQERLAMPARLRINVLDDPHSRDESGLYLTVTGLSAEMGDDGQVGRGNRVNGLITPGRPMSLEAAAGKNPVLHVGKLYNVLALLIARDIHERVGGAQQVQVRLLSAIGEPVDEPRVASIDIASTHEPRPTARAEAAEIANHWLSDVARVTELILEERVSLY